MARDGSTLIDLPRFDSSSGSLSFMQVGDHVPFEIDQVSWSVNPRDEARSSEAAVVALHGSFQVDMEERDGKRAVWLDRPDRLLHVPATTTWSIRRRSEGSLALVVAPDAPDGPWSPLSEGLRPGISVDVNAAESTIDDCEVVELPHSGRPSGGTSLLRFDDRAELRIRRLYYITGVPPDRSRGGHAHRALYQFLVAARGAFDVEIGDGVSKRSIRLTRSDRALMLVPGIWRVLHSFSAGSICLVMASQPYDEGDYIRRYRSFRSFKKR
jgi:hypothetical protein